MSFIVQYPSPALSPYIKQYWTIKGVVDSGTGHIQRVVPNGFAELTFYFGDIPLNMDRPESPIARSVINGQQSSYYNLKVVGSLDLLSIMFTPQGAKHFFKLPLSEIYNRNQSFRDLAGPVADQLEEALFHAADMDSKIKIIEKFFLKQLTSRKEYEYRRVADSIRLIDAVRGSVNVNSLASRACLSRKQYERCFSGFVGIGPKQFLRVIRFQNALFIKQRNRALSLTNLAYMCGYFDQSHMIKDFKAISGYSPASYFAECDPFSDYFS